MTEELKNIVSITPPKSIEDMVKCFVIESPCYSKSDRYKYDLGGDYTQYLSLGTIAGNSYANYIIEIIDLFVNRPQDVNALKDLERIIRGDFKILEALSCSRNEAVLTSVATGIFEALSDAENESTLGAIVANLGPRARKLWNSHIPGFTGKHFKALAEFKVLEWQY